ncbi:MAG: dprA [Herminiimonas sp.]|nr:dprA [Herminiimonas sp.]
MAAGQEIADWLRLAQAVGVGPDTGRKLLTAFGMPNMIFSAGLNALLEHVPLRTASVLDAKSPDSDTLALIEKTLAWADEPGNHVITLADSDYPKSLLEIADPPLVLYAKGRVELLNKPALAIVGSRNASADGCANARRFAEALSRAGLCVVSGLALGIDAAAHEGALLGDAATIAVIGTGADIVYPARNRALAHRVAVQGCLLSEYALGMPAVASNFPRRNRLISGLSHGVLVVEAAAQSGSLITAKMALEQGRDVFAIPGSIHSPLAKGCHQLIRQGAKLVESAQDILEEYGPLSSAALQAETRRAAYARSSATDRDPDTMALLTALGHDPVGIDELAARSGLPVATINASLLALELDGKLEILAGALYRRAGLLS